MNQQQQAVGKTAAKMLLIASCMFAFVFVVMVPLYNVLCDALGINGKTESTPYEVQKVIVDEQREIEIQFIANNNADMPWIFKPKVTSIKVHPGAMNRTTFYAKNPLPQDMTAQAVPSVTPARAAEFFYKTECFCFTEQKLKAGEEVDMGLVFLVDKKLPMDIKTITLSYTLFDISKKVTMQ